MSFIVEYLNYHFPFNCHAYNKFRRIVQNNDVRGFSYKTHVGFQISKFIIERKNASCVQAC
jgi:hypothetical protein